MRAVRELRIEMSGRCNGVGCTLIFHTLDLVLETVSSNSSRYNILFLLIVPLNEFNGPEIGLSARSVREKKKTKIDLIQLKWKVAGTTLLAGGSVHRGKMFLK